ncbi:hypothetical protein NIES4071_82410 [Calothrix sp. NIES-4071]|nr:hypothetical protein NIES4071_82410 [Calothrix sp. NIES-4071]BAZ62510.1 hypothetical protein NIES4105_82340 [Calothrix sp. NIES-4105]
MLSGLSGEKRAVGVFARRADVEQALRELKIANFPMEKVSVIARDAEQVEEIAGVEVKEHTDNQAEEGAVRGALTGGALGSLTGLLVGLGLLAIPGIGPVMLAGAGATALASTFAGGAIGAAAGTLAGALVGLGIPKERADAYSDLISKGYYLVMINGTKEEIVLAERILRNRGVEEWGIYNLPTPPSSRSKYAVGIYKMRHEVEAAFNELKENGYDMNQVSVVAKSVGPLKDISGVEICTPKDDFSALEIPRNVVKEYEYRVSLGDFLVFVSGTDIQLAGARDILERNGMQDFGIYSPSVVSITNNQQVVSNNVEFT